ncbi:MAG: hypothetical protein WCX70_00250 [Candidatus Paceibacterota bacterium]|jgi:hypothetical protein
MDFLNNSNLHHAYLLVGRPENFLIPLRQAFCQRLGISNISSSPDYIEEEYSLFGIKDSHYLRQRQVPSSFSEKGRFFVLIINSITVEAQNALLKTFEEPTAGVYFFVILRSEDLFLPTLKSRFIIIRSSSEIIDENETTAVINFLKMSSAGRLDYVKKNYIKNKETTKGKIYRFLDNLEKISYDVCQTQKQTNKLKILVAIDQAKKNLANPRASVRLILEHLALVI